MNSYDTNFNIFSSYAMEQFHQIRQDIRFNHGTTQTSIKNMIRYQNENHRHYQQFYREMCVFLDVEYGNDGVAWYRGT